MAEAATRLLILLLWFLPPWLDGLSENQRKYLLNCPNQNRTLPCTPADIDAFIYSHLQQAWDLQSVLSKVYIPGVCYENNYKYCPTLLQSCLNVDNYGYNYTIKGECKPKINACSPFTSVHSCGSLPCSQNQYLCHPQGCIPVKSRCNGKCVPIRRLVETLTPNSSYIQADEYKLEKRMLCGNSCLTRKESKGRYHCGQKCQLKSSPCRAQGEELCPQHYTLCGADTCIDRFVQARVIQSTGFSDYFSCGGVCTPASLPCTEDNGTTTCQNGYWLCEDKEQCILKQEIGRERGVSYSQFCDGVSHCRDKSDETYYQCFIVYMNEILLLAVFLTIVVPASILFIFVYRKEVLAMMLKGCALICPQSIESIHGKSYQGNEDEMHLRGVAPEDVD